MKLNCNYCNVEHEDYDVRPYGHNGTLICFDCGIKPENKAEVEKNFGMQLDAAIAASEGIIIMGEPTGPRPLNSNSLV